MSYFLMYMFYYLSMALFSGLISVYLMDKGYSASQVSFVVSCSFILSMFFQPIIGNLNDKYNPKKVNSLLLLISGIFGIIFIFVRSIYMIAIIYSIVLSFINGTNPIIERMATTSSHKYGLIRIWGTIGYATGSQLSGIIYKYISPSSMYLFFSLGIILCIVGIYFTEDIKKENKAEKVKETSMFKMLFNKQLFICIIIACMFYGVTNVNSTYLPAMLQDSGLPINLSTTVIFSATLFELPVILLSNKYMNKISNKQLLMFVFILLMIQFFTYAFINILIIKIIVALLTKSVATMSYIMINMKVIATIVDQYHQMRALALVSTFKSLISIVFQSIGGYIIDIANYSSFYIFLFIISVIAFMITIFYKIDSGNDQQLFD